MCSGLPVSDNWTFYARCYRWGATSENRLKIGELKERGQFGTKFLVQGMVPTNHSSLDVDQECDGRTDTQGDRENNLHALKCLAWSYTEKEWRQHRQAGTTVDSVRPQRKKVTQECEVTAVYLISRCNLVVRKTSKLKTWQRISVSKNWSSSRIVLSLCVPAANCLMSAGLLWRPGNSATASALWSSIREPCIDAIMSRNSSSSTRGFAAMLTHEHTRTHTEQH